MNPPSPCSNAMNPTTPQTHRGKPARIGGYLVERHDAPRGHRLHRPFAALAVAGLLFFGIPPMVLAQSSNESQSPRGLYSLTGVGRSISDAALTNQNISGITVRASWTDVEAQKSVYDWNYVDAQLDRIRAAGKQASLIVVNGGMASPSWLFDEGVETFSFVNTNGYQSSYRQQVRIPVFWDPVLLGHQKRLIAEMGKRFASRPELRSVSAQCANASTDDWRIPGSAEDIAAWTRLGFDPDRLAEACIDILDATMVAFPRQYVRMAIGRVPGGLAGSPDYVAEKVIDHARATYGDRLIPMRHNLAANTPNPQTTDRLHGWQVLYDARPSVAGQMLWPALDTTSCRLNGGSSPCSPATTLGQAVEVGIAYGMQFIEIYESDVRADELQATISRLASLMPVARTPVLASEPGNRDQPVQWVHQPVGALPAGVEHHTFSSPAVGQPVGYSIFLPRSYEQDTLRRYPVIYWLHGKGGDESAATWISSYLRSAINAGTIPETIMVFVNGAEQSFYSDSYDGAIPVETMIIRDLIGHIDGSYRTLAERRGRALEGFSMGGFGALKFAAKYPEMFASVNVYGAAFGDPQDPPIDPVWSEIMFAGDAGLYTSNTPEYWLERNRERILAEGLQLRVVVGDADPTLQSNLRMLDVLNGLGLPHESKVLRGVRHAPRSYYLSEDGAGFSFHGRALGP